MSLPTQTAADLTLGNNPGGDFPTNRQTRTGLEVHRQDGKQLPAGSKEKSGPEKSGQRLTPHPAVDTRAPVPAEVVESPATLAPDGFVGYHETRRHLTRANSVDRAGNGSPAHGCRASRQLTATSSNAPLANVPPKNAQRIARRRGIPGDS